MPIIQQQNMISGKEFIDRGSAKELAGQLQGYAFGYSDGADDIAATLEDSKSQSIAVNSYSVPVEITPSNGKTAMRKAVVTLTNIPVIESNKTRTIDVSTYSAAVEIIPTSGKDYMQKATVTLTNIPVIQSSKSETYTTNGTYAISPDSGNDGIGNVNVTVAVPLETNKAHTINVSTYTSAVAINPTSGNTAMKKVTVTLTNIPVIQSSKSATYTANGTYTVSPDSGNNGIGSVSVTVAVPLETNKTKTIDVSTYSSAVAISPTSGNTAMKKATVTLTNIPVIQSSKSETYTANGTYTISPDSGNNGLASVSVTVNVPLETNKAYTIDVSTYSAAVAITPTSGKTAMKKATVTLTNIPVLETNKAYTLDASTYSSAVAITPTSGNTAMKKVTVTLTNIPVLETNKTYTVSANTLQSFANGQSVTINPTSGKTAMKKATLSVASNFAAQHGLTISPILFKNIDSSLTYLALLVGDKSLSNLNTQANIRSNLPTKSCLVFMGGFDTNFSGVNSPMPLGGIIMQMFGLQTSSALSSATFTNITNSNEQFQARCTTTGITLNVTTNKNEIQMFVPSTWGTSVANFPDFIPLNTLLFV